MHPYVKQQLPCQVLCFIVILLVATCSISSQSCYSRVRTVTIYSVLSGGHVRVEGKRIVATGSEKYYLQKITIDRHLYLLFDSVAKMYICWNRRFINLEAKRNPKDLRYCKFEDKVSLINTGYLRSTTTYPLRNGTLRESEMRFNQHGHFGTRNGIRKCIGHKRKKWKELSSRMNLNAMVMLNPLHVPENEINTYFHISKYCASPDFVQNTTKCNGDQLFCQHVRKVHSHHRVACELIRLCQIKDVKSNC